MAHNLFISLFTGLGLGLSYMISNTFTKKKVHLDKKVVKNMIWVTIICFLTLMFLDVFV